MNQKKVLYFGKGGHLILSYDHILNFYNGSVKSGMLVVRGRKRVDLEQDLTITNAKNAYLQSDS